MANAGRDTWSASVHRDDVHGTYEPAQAHRFWQALVTMLPVFTEFRARFLGAGHPIHLFWGGLDLSHHPLLADRTAAPGRSTEL